MRFALCLVLLGRIVGGKPPKIAPPPAPAPVSAALPDVKITTPYGEFRFSNLHIVAPHGLATLEGSVTNATTRAWHNLSFVLRFYTPSGPVTSPLWAIRFGNLEVKPNDVLAFGDVMSAPHLGIVFAEPPPSNASRPELALGDESEFAVGYSISMLKPHEQKPQPDRISTYEDDSVQMAFQPALNGIAFMVRNKTDSVAKLSWDSTSFVDFDGNSVQVAHEGVKFAELSGVKPPSIIPPTAKITDSMFPTNIVTMGSKGWKVAELFPYGPAAFSMVGKTFGILLPLEFGGKTTQYFFQFRIESVQ